MLVSFLGPSRPSHLSEMIFIYYLPQVLPVMWAAREYWSYIVAIFMWPQLSIFSLIIPNLFNPPGLKTFPFVDPEKLKRGGYLRHGSLRKLTTAHFCWGLISVAAWREPLNWFPEWLRSWLFQIIQIDMIAYSMHIYICIHTPIYILLLLIIFMVIIIIIIIYYYYYCYYYYYYYYNC